MLAAAIDTETAMSLDHTARLGLPYLAAGQMQKHVTLNDALTRLDALVHCAVASRTQVAPPADPPDGVMHIVAADASPGDWNGAGPDALVRPESGQWLAVDRAPGLTAWVMDQAALVVWDGQMWRAIGGDAPQSLPRLGINTTPDEVNRFAARLNTALWTALAEAEGGSGDLRYVMNKEGPSRVLSLLMQSAWSGRAELGLIGDDDLTLKVSADGDAWREALRVDRATGRVSFTGGALRGAVTVMTESGLYAPPTWARRVRVILTAGGGGGGGGASGPGSTSRFGGGGGGAGGRSDGEWAAADLAGGLVVTIGQGGTGGDGAGGVGSGVAGAAGGLSEIATPVGSLLRATGGAGGGGGSTSNGAAGAGGLGAVRSNPGGAATLVTNGGGGVYATCPDRAAGGAAGGSLASETTARAGGPGGIGFFMGGLGSQAAAGTAGAVEAAGGDGGSAPLGEAVLGGGGGGGGGASVSGSGASGGAGGAPGGGGGGGGAGPDAGGGGGRGGDGRAVIVALG